MNVIIRVTNEVKAVVVPVGTDFGSLSVNINTPDGIAFRTSVTDDTGNIQTDVTFTDIPDGSYTAIARRLDKNGNVIGDPVTSDFTVAGVNTVTGMVPTSITVVLQ